MHLFDTALAARLGQTQYGGICYGFAPDGACATPTSISGYRRNPWPPRRCWHARSGGAVYWDWYQRIWGYSWEHLVDHQYGAWYRILTRDNRKYSDEKSPAGKTDYHTMGACYEVLRLLRNEVRP